MHYAWNIDGQNSVPQPGQYLAGVPVREYRQLDLLLTPHGFLKAALASNPTAISVTLPSSPGAITANGKATLVSFSNEERSLAVPQLPHCSSVDGIVRGIGGVLEQELRKASWRVALANPWR
jgi:hypothetical protein